MNNEIYIKDILGKLLTKYYNRKSSNRVSVKPTDIYKKYAKNNANIIKKQNLYETIVELEKQEFITVKFLKYSTDVEKIYLIDNSVSKIEEYLNNNFMITPKNVISDNIRLMVTKYQSKGDATNNYCNTILLQLNDYNNKLELEKVEANLKMISFLENNQENLYVREASMIVYGDSKWFENNNYKEICKYLSEYNNKLENDNYDDVLSLYHINLIEQEILIKGNWLIEWENHLLDVSKYQGGIAIQSSDIRSIKKIIINSNNFMTIENKTSFQRMNDEKYAMMYLGGYANRNQIEFLKMVIKDNDIKYYHFGDIDIGGFLIHRHLCKQTNKSFGLFNMSMNELQNNNYNNCLKKLYDNDEVDKRIDSLLEDDLYRDVVEYMIRNNVKLEQEIISYYLSK